MDIISVIIHRDQQAVTCYEYIYYAHCLVDTSRSTQHLAHTNVGLKSVPVQFRCQLALGAGLGVLVILVRSSLNNPSWSTLTTLSTLG